MKYRAIRLAAIAGSALFCFGLPVMGQVTVQFTGGYSTTFSNSDGSFGAGIYSANINGAPSASGIICDDYKDEVTSGETWTANAIQASALNAGNIGNTLFGNNNSNLGTTGIGLPGYAEVATLVSMMFGNISTYGSITGVTQSELSSAIWFITANPAGISGLDTTAQALVAAVQAAFGGNTHKAQAYLATLTNLWILTPTPQGKGEPQEMWTVSVPEGGAAFLYLLLAGVSCFGAMFVSSRRQAANQIAA
jgi:hypothetical protein